MLEDELKDWMKNVLTAYESKGSVDTYKMIVDVDKIIADAFDHDTIIIQD